MSVCRPWRGSNGVGYVTSDIKANFAATIDAFAPVTGSDIDIQSIKVKGEGLAAGDVQITTINAFTATDRTFYWIPESEAADYDMESEGWYDADEFMPAEKVFSVGEGFITVNNASDGAVITYAGQVPVGATIIPLSPNFSASGNMLPVALDLQSIIVEGDGLAAGDVQIQTINAFTATDRTFYWIPESEAADYDMKSEGWYDADEFIPAEDVTFEAGEGFIVVNNAGDANMKLPSPL